MGAERPTASYRVFLGKLNEQLQKAIGEAENQEWHHFEEGTMPWEHYRNLVNWESEVQQRMDWYDDIKASRT